MDPQWYPGKEPDEVELLRAEVRRLRGVVARLNEEARRRSVKLTIVELDPNGDGVDFWKHASYRLKIDGEYVGANIPALEVLQLIEEEMVKRSYVSRS